MKGLERTGWFSRWGNGEREKRTAREIDPVLLPITVPHSRFRKKTNNDSLLIHT